MQMDVALDDEAILEELADVFAYIGVVKGGKRIRELAKAISLASFGSSHTLFLPHFSTEAANLFCSLRFGIIPYEPLYDLILTSIIVIGMCFL